MYRERQQSRHANLLPEHDAQVFDRELSQRLASQFRATPHERRDVLAGVRPNVPFKLLDGRHGGQGSPQRSKLSAYGRARVAIARCRTTSKTEPSPPPYKAQVATGHCCTNTIRGLR